MQLQYIKDKFNPKQFEITIGSLSSKIAGYKHVGSSLVVYLSQTITPQEKVDLDAYIQNHTGQADPLDIEKSNTEQKMREGFELYQKIFSHITLNDPVSSIDGFLSIYPAISLLRMLLKDAMFESALRFMATKQELTAFSHLSTYQSWVRELAKKYNSSLSDALISAIENAPAGQV